MRWFRTVSRMLPSYRPTRRPGRSLSKRTGFRPRIEYLESRWVPTTVTNLNDSGLGSLRYAIQQTPNGGTVDFAPGLEGTIKLFSGTLQIFQHVTIDGPGADKITVSGNDTAQVMHIFNGIGEQITVDISGLTFANGIAQPPQILDPIAGGALFNRGAIVSFTDCVIADNDALEPDSLGAGIYNTWDLALLVPGEIYLTNTVVTENVAVSSLGSGILNEGILALDNSSVIFNTGTDVNGGGIYNVGLLTMFESAVSDNTTLVNFEPGLGAGIYNSGLAEITNSIISGNVGPSSGGGIYTDGGELIITNSTITDNEAVVSGIWNSDGGGIWNNNTEITITNSTIARNDAGRGGGLFLTLGSVPQITLRNTIVARNVVSTSGPDVQGQVQIAFNNLIGDGTGSAGLVDGENGNQVGNFLTPILPLLGTLKDNGGPTRTLALLPGSPAIDAGTNTGAPSDDQRGFNRPVNTIVDIGAYEYQPTQTNAVLVSSLNPSIVGDSVTFTATVTGIAPGSNPAQGNVIFKDGAATLATVALVNGVASFTTDDLAMGTHPISVSYPGFVEGDYVLDPDTSNTINQLVRSASSLEMKSYTNPANTANFIMFAGIVTGIPGLFPTGTVEFFNNGNPFGSAPLDQGVACLIFDPFTLPPGTYTVTGTYSGDNNYAPSSSPTPVVVLVGATTSDLTVNPSPANTPDNVTLTATVTKVAPGTQVPTGNVSFFDGGNLIGTVALNGSAQAVLVTTFAKGTHSITATYAGDTDFTGSGAPAKNLVVGASVTLVESLPNPSDVGQQVTLEAIATSFAGGALTPTGFIEFYDEGNFLGSAAISGASAQLQVVFNTVGNHLITAIYTGDVNFTSSTSIPLVHVVGANTTFLSVNPNPSSVNQTVTLSATVVPETGVVTPTGSVTFSTQFGVLGNATLNGSGTAVLNVSNFPAGSFTVTAEYSGDSNYAPTRSGPQSLTVNATATSAALQVSPISSNFGDLVTFTATVTPAITGSFTPTGTVTFFDRTTPLGTVNVGAGGVAVFSSNTLPGGVRYVTAKYNGDANFTVSTSAIVNQLTQPISYFAVGGAPGKVRFYNPDNTLVVAFSPFGGNYTGGVNVAIGDVDGDGYNDLVIGANVGNPDVRVYSGKLLAQNPGSPNGALLVQFFAYGLGFNVGANVAIGDINDDGFADLVTGATAGNPHTKVFNGKDIADDTFNPSGASLLAEWFPYGLQFNVGSRVNVGDVNGDGYADVVTGASAGNPDTRVFNGKDIALGGFNPAGSSLLASWFAFGLNFNVGANVAVADINGDGYGDVITGATVGNPAVKVFSGKDIALGTFNPNGSSLLTSFFAYELNFNVGVFIGGADFDGDGNAEIITGASVGAPHYRVVAGNSIGIKPPAIFEAFADGIQGGVTVGASSLFLPPT